MVGKAHNKADFQQLRRLKGQSEGQPQPCLVIYTFVNLQTDEERQQHEENRNRYVQLPELYYKMVIYIRNYHRRGKPHKHCGKLDF